MGKILIGFLILGLGSVSFAAKYLTPVGPHILPDAPSSAYQALAKRLSKQFSNASSDPVIQLGERNLQWLKYMNSFRPEGKKLQFTKPGQLTGIPIDAPKNYNAEIIQAEYDSLKANMPAEMNKVLYSTGPFPESQNPPVDDDKYTLWARKVDRNYQTAIRWSGMAPWLPELENRRDGDLRGFYFLSQKTDNVESVLRTISSLPLERQKQIKEWLTQMCQNRDGLNNGCETQIENSVQAKTAYEAYLRYLSNSQELWNSYFGLENPRSEITWSQSNSNQMVVPFRDPSDNVILNYLRINIQDEWKWNGWQLLLDFRKQADIHVEFQPGVTPHVNGLGGNTITMDANAPLSEWDVQWTIRHEFGHVLGFKDCYLEFYDPNSSAIVSYQLDITNLMCSRAGRLKQTHFDTLKKSYYK